MRWIFSAMTVLAVGAMASWAPAGDCCGGGQAGGGVYVGGGVYAYEGMYSSGGMYGNGLSALSARPCAVPIYGWTENFCPETPRCVNIWDNYCDQQRCRGCGCGRPCGSDCGPTRVWVAGGMAGGTVIEQTMEPKPTAIVKIAAVSEFPDPPEASKSQIRLLPKVEPSLEPTVPPEPAWADSR